MPARLEDHKTGLVEGQMAILDKYLHVDNGGYYFRIVAQSNGDDIAGYFTNGLEIEVSFCGVQTKLSLPNLAGEALEQLGKELILAGERLNQLNKPFDENEKELRLKAAGSRG